VLVAHGDGHAVRASRLGGRRLHASVVGPGALVGPDDVGEPPAGSDADRLRRAVGRNDRVGVWIDDDERHLHRVQQVLLLGERALGSKALAIGAAAVDLEAGEQHRQDTAEEDDGSDRKDRRALRKSHDEPRVVGHLERRHGAGIAHDRMLEGRAIVRGRRRRVAGRQRRDR
jgi:hypothetical protein